jgi:hypothetical protein
MGRLPHPHLPWFAFAAKLVFTSFTLSAGFLGGEVTPLRDYRSIPPPSSTAGRTGEGRG